MIKKLLIIFTITLTHLQGDMMLKGKPEINFYTKGKLMWLIDTTSMNKEYVMMSLNEMKISDPDLLERSFETYLNHANTNKKYKYNDWRLPTIEELKTLEYKGGWIRRLFTSSKHVKNDISINKDIFYDIYNDSEADYWASDITPEINGKKTFGNVYFADKRFKEYYLDDGYNGRGGAAGGSIPSIKSKYDTGMYIGYGEYTSESHLRLVRDIKEN